jgi:hypothetical protein
MTTGVQSCAGIARRKRMNKRPAHLKGRPCKYTADQIRSWRAQIECGMETFASLGKKLGVNKGTVHQTLFGKGRYQWVK